jgi:hypothetical protein
MRFKIILLLTVICLISYNSVLAQSQVKPVDYEIGVVFASGQLFKLKGSIIVADSTFTTILDDKTQKLPIVKYSELSNKYLLSDGIDEFIFTITENKGKMKGFEHNYTGLFEIKGKSGSIMYYLNKK